MHPMKKPHHKIARLHPLQVQDLAAVRGGDNGVIHVEKDNGVIFVQK